MSRFDILLNKNPEPQLSPATTLQEVLNNQGEVLLSDLYCAICGRNLKNGRIIQDNLYKKHIFCLGCERYIRLSNTRINISDKCNLEDLLRGIL